MHIRRPLGYERVYLPLYKVADTPFHIQGDEESEILMDSHPYGYETSIFTLVAPHEEA